MNSRTHRIPRRRAFTLIELLVVITIVTVLVAMILPAVSNARETAQGVICGGRLHQVGIAFFSRINDYKQLFPIASPTGGSDGAANSWCFGGQYDEQLGSLTKNNGYMTKNLMACPGHQTHGDGVTLDYPNHGHIDYGVGWHAIIGNAGGLRNRDNTRYFPPNCFWGNDYPAIAPQLPYTPTLDQYTDQWFRNTGRYYGSAALISDIVAGNWCPFRGDLGKNFAGGVPHMGNINVLCVDGRVKSIGRGFYTYGYYDPTVFTRGFGAGFGYFDAPWWENIDGAVR